MSSTDGAGHNGGHPAGHLPLTPEEVDSLTNVQLLQVALKQSLLFGPFIDTKFYAFSRRQRSGVVDKPLPLYASGAILRAHSTHFEGFFDGFNEAKMTSLCSGFPEDKDNFTEAYDYDNDSDLEYDPEASEEDLHEGVTEGQRQCAHSESTSATVSEVIDRTDRAAFVGGQHGRVIVIPNVAHTTLAAMIYFLYTGELNFLPLSSSLEHTTQSTKETVHSHSSRSQPWDTPQCSPKSMYRLADMFGLSGLKAKAKENIVSKLTTDNISTEIRSSFTSMYDEIREITVNFACEHTRLPIILSILPEWLEELATGRIPNAASTVAAIVSKVTTIAPNPPADHEPHSLRCKACASPQQPGARGIQCFCRHCDKWEAMELINH